jgi:hypothetical protein
MVGNDDGVALGGAGVKLEEGVIVGVAVSVSEGVSVGAREAVALGGRGVGWTATEVAWGVGVT